jgi:hypothetical protein
MGISRNTPLHVFSTLCDRVKRNKIMLLDLLRERICKYDEFYNVAIFGLLFEKVVHFFV